mgnify:CR=1 FL=1
MTDDVSVSAITNNSFKKFYNESMNRFTDVMGREYFQLPEQIGSDEWVFRNRRSSEHNNQWLVGDDEIQDRNDKKRSWIVDYVSMNNPGYRGKQAHNSKVVGIIHLTPQ